MKRNTRKRTADPIKIAEHAEAFVRTARLLRKEIAGDHLHHLTVALAVNASLALELYSKCLSVCERGFYFEDHDLKGLYNDLCSETRIEIERRHVALESHRSFNRTRALGIDLSVGHLIEVGRDVFTRWRYGFEEPNASSVWNLDGVLLVVRKYVLEEYIQLKEPNEL